MTVTPQGDGVPLQPAQGEQRQGNRGHRPPYIYIARQFKKKISGPTAANLPSLPPKAPLHGEKAGAGRRRRAYHPLSQAWRFHFVAFGLNFHQDYTVHDSCYME